MSDVDFRAYEDALLDRVPADPRKPARTGRTTLEVEHHVAPAAWSSAAVNGDFSGLSDGEESDCRKWLSGLGDRANVVDVDEGDDFGVFFFWSEGRCLGCDRATYTVLVERDV